MGKDSGLNHKPKKRIEAEPCNQEEQSCKNQGGKSVYFDSVKIGKEKTITWPKRIRIQGLRDRKKLEKLDI